MHHFDANIHMKDEKFFLIIAPCSSVLGGHPAVIFDRTSLWLQQIVKLKQRQSWIRGRKGRRREGKDWLYPTSYYDITMYYHRRVIAHQKPY